MEGNLEMAQTQTAGFDVAILGSGPAGLTAAIYASRACLKTCVLEGPIPGGQLTTTTEVENFPGFPEGVQGPEFMEKMRQQAARFGAQIIAKPATSVDFALRPFCVTFDGGELEADTVIIATGASAKLLGLEKEKQFMGKGLSACATCDGFFFRGKEVAIVGGGDTAVEEALFLTRFATKVKVIHRRDALRASKIMQERGLSHPKIEFLWNRVVADLIGDAKGGLKGVVLLDVKTNKEEEVPLDGLFIAIGHEPNTKLFMGKLAMDERGYILTHENVRTSIEGVFACGDVQDSAFRQAVTAAGSGCMAAILAERFLEEHYASLQIKA
jgi:thioredoxin reductase (NADPH)